MSQVSGQLRADPQLFRWALSNLLANAIRYASADSLIEGGGPAPIGEFLLRGERPRQAVRPNCCPPVRPVSTVATPRGDAQSSGLGLAIVRRSCASAAAPKRVHWSGRIRFDLAFPAQD